MTHGVHGVVRLVAVERPVAGVVGENVEGADGADRHVGRRLRILRGLGHPPSVGAAHGEAVPVQMDGMIRHAQVADTHADLVAEAHRQRIDSGKHAAVPGPHVEVGHLVDLRQVGAGIDVVGAHDEDEVAVDRPERLVARMHDEHAHHAHRHLHHLVRMRVVHERPARLDLEFVDEGLARLDVRLIEAAHSVHSVRHDHAVPVHRGVFGQFVGDEDAHLVAFDRFDGWTRSLPVVAPQVCFHPFREFAHHGFGDEMEFLPVAVHPPWQRPSVERHDRAVVGTGRGMEGRLQHRLFHDRRFRNVGGLHPAAHGAGAYQRRRSEKSSSR